MSNNAVRVLTPALAMMGWQYGEQYLASLYAGQSLDISSIDLHVPVNEVLPFAYPILFGTLAWVGAFFLWNKKENNKDNTNKSVTNSQAYVGWNVLLSMTGAALGLFLADNQDWGNGASATSMGVGFALPGLLINGFYYMADAKNNTKKNIGISTVCAFAAGISWYGASMLPRFVAEMGGDSFTFELMKSVVSPAVTLLATALFLGLASAADKQGDFLHAQSVNDQKTQRRGRGLWGW
ncbi:MAG: hypothetical protein ACHQAX_08130 [Gammaproteobacteria bacterium]